VLPTGERPDTSVKRNSPVTRARRSVPSTSPRVVSESRPEIRTTDLYLATPRGAKYPDEAHPGLPAARVRR